MFIRTKFGLFCPAFVSLKDNTLINRIIEINFFFYIFVLIYLYFHFIRVFLNINIIVIRVAVTAFVLISGGFFTSGSHQSCTSASL